MCKHLRHGSIALAAVFALGVAGTAMAQAPSFDELDADTDGLINREEAANLPCLSGSFDSVEKADPTGLNQDEFAQAVSSYCSG